MRFLILPVIALIGLLLFAQTANPAPPQPPTAEPKTHWSLRSIKKPAAPQVANAEWVRNPIDAFILARLQAARLTAAPEADRATLVRRATFDLTGLPPTPDELEQAQSDKSPDWYERLVDRLLARPQYGEKWGRHWLDVVRFAETEGFEYDRYRPGAWRYRDYVIAAFNADKPYDRFVLEQLAGDELPHATQETRTAAGFHRLGPVRRNAGNPDVAFSRNEVLTEMTDAVGTVFLGMTIGCARCHDHKFDPIPQADYYRIQAFLASAHEDDIALADPAAHARWKTETARITDEIDRLKQEIKDIEGDAKRKMEAKLRDLEQAMPAPLPTISSVHDEPGKRTAIHILKRGDPAKKGDAVAPRMLSALLPADAPALPADVPNPRMRLAQWIADPANPLTARVMVNRVWQYHFGKGIVATANDFGINGARPTHPELLDWLAGELIAGGWSVKSLHRVIMTSATYRQSSIAKPQVALADPQNRLLARFPLRRLSAEEVRDAMLAVSGSLNGKFGGESVVPPVDPDLVKLLYEPKSWTVTKDPAEHDRRSVYLIVKRNLPLPFSQVFDQPDAQTSCACREQSTHPLQALELLNGKTANRLASVFARRLVREAGTDQARQVERAYLLAAGRPPTPRERGLALAFLADAPLEEFALALFNINPFLYVE